MNKLERENKHVSVFGWFWIFTIIFCQNDRHSCYLYYYPKKIYSFISVMKPVNRRLAVIIGLLFITSVIDIFISVILFQQHKNNEIRSLILFSMFLRSHKTLHGRRNKNKNHFHQILFLKLKKISFLSHLSSVRGNFLQSLPFSDFISAQLLHMLQ